MNINYINIDSKLNLSDLQMGCDTENLSSDDVVSVKRMIKKRKFFWKFIITMTIAVIIASFVILFSTGSSAFIDSFGLIIFILSIGLISFAIAGKYFTAKPVDLLKDLEKFKKEIYRTTVIAVKVDHTMEPEIIYAELMGCSSALRIYKGMQLKEGDRVIIERLPVSGNVLSVRKAE